MFTSDLILSKKDDFKAQETLLDLQEHYVDGDPDIYLLSDPQKIGHEEANAFQRYSSVILQRSIREGLGFTVTEAMWKNQPVVSWTNDKHTKSAGRWLETAEPHQGSWWLDWLEWTKPRSGELVSPPSMGSQAYPPIIPAPGKYVLEK